MKELAAERRIVKLAAMREQVESGSLVIRRMTDEERRRYPAIPRAEKRGRF